MDIQEQIKLLHYHQKLLLKMIDNNSKDRFYKLIIENKLSEKDVSEFNKLCEKMSKKLEEQKAEGLIYFHPLVMEMEKELHHSLSIIEVVDACISQQLYMDLMVELRKWLK